MRKLSLLQKIELRLYGQTYIGHKTKPGWSGSEPFYLVRCKKHGLFETYPQGHKRKMICPECWKELINV